jgi:hypothetical protein
MPSKFNDVEEDDSRYEFLVFVQKNKDIIDELIKDIPKGQKRKRIIEAYENFILDFNLNDDADHGAMFESFENNWDKYLVKIVKEFVEWFESAETQEKFNKIISDRREHKKEKRRTQKRTSVFKNELAEKDIVPEDNPHSVFGKTYRTARDRFNSRTGGKKRRTQKKRL